MAIQYQKKLMPNSSDLKMPNSSDFDGIYPYVIQRNEEINCEISVQIAKENLNSYPNNSYDLRYKNIKTMISQ